MSRCSWVVGGVVDHKRASSMAAMRAHLCGCALWSDVRCCIRMRIVGHAARLFVFCACAPGLTPLVACLKGTESFPQDAEQHPLQVGKQGAIRWPELSLTVVCRVVWCGAAGVRKQSETTQLTHCLCNTCARRAYAAHGHTNTPAHTRTHVCRRLGKPQ